MTSQINLDQTDSSFRQRMVMHRDVHCLFRWVTALALMLTLLFASLNFLADVLHRGKWEQTTILTITGLYMTATLISLLAVWFSVRIEPPRARQWLLKVIILFAICFRLIQIFSPPILEIDLYRYMWDGIVTNEGLSPYQFSPEQALGQGETKGVDADRVIALANSTESVNRILTQVHFKDYTTIYPPVSQFVFAGAMMMVPNTANVAMHVFAMKTVLVLFDIGTILLLSCLIRQCGRHVGWLIAYAWNPLVIKEIANSGHLDSIVVFFCVLASSFAVTFARTMVARGRPSGGWVQATLSASFLALAVGAKLFPVILVPLFVTTIARVNKRFAFWFGLVFVASTIGSLLPMAIFQPVLAEPAAVTDSTMIENEGAAKDGLTGFLTGWRMNDLVFNLVYENAKPDSKLGVNLAWYAIVPNQNREAFHELARERWGMADPAYSVARVVTLGLFGLLYLAILVDLLRRPPGEEVFLESCFLIIAAFFFLQPTQNPWYWTWAMPFVCFARNRGWLAVSGFLFIYYLRFWFKRYEGDFSFAGYSYTNVGFFDHVVVWLEYGAMLICLVAGRLQVRFRKPEVKID